MRVLWLMKVPIASTEPSSTTTPSTTSERAPMKQLSSMIVGLACTGSSTPPMPTPPQRGTLRPVWAGGPAGAPAAYAAPAREVHVAPDLGAGADGRPRVHHGALVDVRPDVHK